MELEEAMSRCNELIKPKHANWIGISNQKAIETVLNSVNEFANKYCFEKTAKEEVEELLENSVSKDMIKEFLEELNKEEKQIYKKDIGNKEIYRLSVIDKLKEILQELLK